VWCEFCRSSLGVLSSLDSGGMRFSLGGGGGGGGVAESLRFDEMSGDCTIGIGLWFDVVDDM
jgi:hypothetical protein